MSKNKDVGSVVRCEDCGQFYKTTKVHSKYNNTCSGKK